MYGAYCGQICFLHLHQYKNCRKTSTERPVLHVGIIYTTWWFGLSSLLCCYRNRLLRLPASTGSSSVNVRTRCKCTTRIYSPEQSQPTPAQWLAKSEDLEAGGDCPAKGCLLRRGSYQIELGDAAMQAWPNTTKIASTLVVLCRCFYYVADEGSFAPFHKNLIIFCIYCDKLLQGVKWLEVCYMGAAAPKAVSEKTYKDAVLHSDFLGVVLV